MASSKQLGRDVAGAQALAQRLGLAQLAETEAELDQRLGRGGAQLADVVRGCQHLHERAADVVVARLDRDRVREADPDVRHQPAGREGAERRPTNVTLRLPDLNGSVSMAECA